MVPKVRILPLPPKFGIQISAKNIEGGVVTKPSVQTIQKIAKSLGVPMEELLK